ncbi:terminase [Bombilactobacillus bombi]|uniref:Terminase n=2 Tax=Bombilactobacillus bombi TaxID=1303590 RepID=A0A417ZGD9_9LACO|nr:terminase [Bombilactobacillus bombi]
MKYKDIASKYKVSLNTVKSWKTRYKWQRASNQKGMHTKNKKGARKTKSSAVIEELSNSTLNERQKAFVLEYLRILNATQAYINVYDVSYNVAKTNGPRLLGNARIQKEISNIREARLKELAVEPLDLIADLAKEARSDIGDFVGFNSWEEILYDSNGMPVKDANGKKITYHRSNLYFKDQNKIDTSLIKKISQGKDGPVIELYDKTKARDKLLEWLQDIQTDGTESVHIQIDVPKSRKEKSANDRNQDE